MGRILRVQASDFPIIIIIIIIIIESHNALIKGTIVRVEVRHNFY